MSWKDEFAEEAVKALDHPLVTGNVEEFTFNMARFVDLSSGLPKYGLNKLMRYVAIVTRAQTMGIDPDALRLSRDEADDVILAKLEAFRRAGAPSMVVVTGADTATGSRE